MNVRIASDVIAAAADIAIVVDADGVIRDLSVGADGPQPSPGKDWIGMRLIDTAAIDSRAKVEALLQEARDSSVTRAREINHQQPGAGLPSFSFRYCAVRMDEEGGVLAIGRDLGATAALQQQLVTAQQSMEREYALIRQSETRYRLLFQVSSEGVLIADAANLKIAECNPAASAFLAEPQQKLQGRLLSSLFAPKSWPPLLAMLTAVHHDGRANQLLAELADGSREVRVAASLFRQAQTAHLLIRLLPENGETAASNSDRARALTILERMPDGFVLVDADWRIQIANAAFLDLVQLASENQVRGEPLDRWLGRAGVDVNILVANIREHGSVRNFATLLRGEYGASQEAMVSGVSATSLGKPCFGFVIRSVSSRLQFTPGPAAAPLARSVEQLRGLVGRVSLKEIVRESTDLVERLCIEAALEVSGDNRASAAELLGLSRQSLYSKLRKLGLGDLGPEDT